MDNQKESCVRSERGRKRPVCDADSSGSAPSGSTPFSKARVQVRLSFWCVFGLRGGNGFGSWISPRQTLLFHYVVAIIEVEIINLLGWSPAVQPSNSQMLQAGGRRRLESKQQRVLSAGGKSGRDTLPLARQATVSANSLRPRPASIRNQGLVSP